MAEDERIVRAACARHLLVVTVLLLLCVAASAQPAAPAPAPPKASLVVDPPEIKRLQDELTLAVQRADYAALDRTADQLRTTKARFPGGDWQLHTLYQELRKLPGGTKAA